MMTKEEKNDRVLEMRAFHQNTMEQIAKGQQYRFFPKVPFLRSNGLRVIGFFRSELENSDLNLTFIECINLKYEPLDGRRTLYQLRFNPHFKDEYEHVGNDRYNVPIDDLIVVSELALKESNLAILADFEERKSYVQSTPVHKYIEKIIPLLEYRQSLSREYANNPELMDYIDQVDKNIKQALHIK